MGRPRNFDKPEKWTDFYRPIDHFALANSYAKNYCKTHPEIDKNTVYSAAADAAFQYENSVELQRHKFKVFINVKIRNAVLEIKRKEKDMAKYSNELKAAIMADKDGGMTCREIAEKYGLTPKQVENIIYHPPKETVASGQEPTDPQESKKNSPPKASRTAGMWEAIANELPEILTGLFGAGVKIQSISSDEEYEKAIVKGVTPDGIGVRIKAEVK